MAVVRLVHRIIVISRPPVILRKYVAGLV